MINTDWFLKTGYSHKICQDYVLTGPDYIILADGCSSSEHVDIGARILCQCARNYIETFKHLLFATSTEQAGKSIIMMAKVTCDSLSLPYTTLDSTLLFSVLVGNKIFTYMFGDGSVAYSRDGNIKLITVTYPLNAPFYLSYLLDKERFKIYEKLTDLKYTYVEEEIIGSVDAIQKSKEGSKWHSMSFIDINTKYIDNFILTSDGLSSFVDFSTGGSTSIDKNNILRQTMSFKNFKGEFIRRRASKMMEEFEKNKIKHYDDFSVVGFHFEE
jgi:serine/threonine protein phosphatase PrpC